MYIYVNVEQPNAARPEENTNTPQLDGSPAILSDRPMHLTTPTTARGPALPVASSGLNVLDVHGMGLR